jgi:hypothetical protein
MRVWTLAAVSAIFAVLIFFRGQAPLQGAAEPPSKERPAADESPQAAERNALRRQMSARISKVKVALVDEPNRAVEFVSRPLMTYTDEPLSIDAATLWAWSLRKDGRPIAICKVEHYDAARRAVPNEWLYCFASLSADLIQADWPDGHHWTARRPGVSFREIPDAPVPGETPAACLRQMKDLSRRFSASIDFGEKVHEELRLLTQPVYSYADAEAGIIQGTIFASTGNGTNPTALFFVELQKVEEKPHWKFGVGAITDAGVTVKYDGKEVWSKPALHAPGKDFETWTYFFEKPAAK